MKVWQFVVGLFFLGLGAGLANAQPGASYTLTVDSVLNPYVDDVVQGPPAAKFDDGNELRSIATFSIRNNSRDPMFVRVQCEMIGNGESVGGKYDSGVVKIESGKQVAFDGVGVEYQTPDRALDSYVAHMTLRISYDAEMAEAHDDIAAGSWTNRYRKRRRK